MTSRITFRDADGRELAVGFGDVPAEGHRVTLDLNLTGRRDYRVLGIMDDAEPHWWYGDNHSRGSVAQVIQQHVYVTLTPLGAPT